MQIADALVVLRKVKAEFESRGYEVQTLRLTTQPLAEFVAGMSDDQALAFLKQLDDLSVKENFLPNVGPAMLHDSDDPATMHLLERALSALPDIEASAIIADQAGIHWKTIRRTAELVKYVTEHSPRSQGNFNFTATAMLKPFSPFFPGSYHLGAGKQFAVGFEGANVVSDVFTKDKGNAEAAIADLTVALTKHTSVAAAVGKKIAAETGWSYMESTLPGAFGRGIHWSCHRSVHRREIRLQRDPHRSAYHHHCGEGCASEQVGYSGLMVPVMEDRVLAERWAESTYNIDSLLAYSAVCGTGLDTVPLPGDISIEQMERIFADVASLAMKWNKPLSARLQPVQGKKPGDQTEFQDPYLFNTTIHPLQ